MTPGSARLSAAPMPVRHGLELLGVPAIQRADAAELGGSRQLTSAVLPLSRFCDGCHALRLQSRVSVTYAPVSLARAAGAEQSVAARAAIISRADRQHARVLASDQHGISGNYPPAV